MCVCPLDLELFSGWAFLSNITVKCITSIAVNSSMLNLFEMQFLRTQNFVSFIHGMLVCSCLDNLIIHWRIS